MTIINQSLKAFSNTDRLFLLTQPSSNIVEQESNMINGARKAGIKHVVKQSAMGADDINSNVQLLRIHRQSEKIIQEYEIVYAFLRPNEFMQNFKMFHSPVIKNANALHLPSGNAEVNISYILCFRNA